MCECVCVCVDVLRLALTIEDYPLRQITQVPCIIIVEVCDTV